MMEEMGDGRRRRPSVAPAVADVPLCRSIDQSIDRTRKIEIAGRSIESCVMSCLVGFVWGLLGFPARRRRLRLFSARQHPSCSPTRRGGRAALVRLDVVRSHARAKQPPITLGNLSTGRHWGAGGIRSAFTPSRARLNSIHPNTPTTCLARKVFFNLPTRTPHDTHRHARDRRDHGLQHPDGNASEAERCGDGVGPARVADAPALPGGPAHGCGGQSLNTGPIDSCMCDLTDQWTRLEPLVM